jgi:hypothetical protein
MTDARAPHHLTNTAHTASDTCFCYPYLGHFIPMHPPRWNLSSLCMVYYRFPCSWSMSLTDLLGPHSPSSKLGRVCWHPTRTTQARKAFPRCRMNCCHYSSPLFTQLCCLALVCLSCASPLFRPLPLLPVFLYLVLYAIIFLRCRCLSPCAVVSLARALRSASMLG